MNKKDLDSFVKYCNENPNQRFWQALRNWSKYNFIFVADKLDDNFKPINPRDTFYD